MHASDAESDSSLNPNPSRPVSSSPHAFDTAHVEQGSPSHVASFGGLICLKTSVGPWDNNTYFLMDTATREAIVVDAAAEPERILSLVHEYEATLLGVITTHRHADHTGALSDVLSASRAWSGAHAQDSSALPAPVTRTLEDGDLIAFGAGQLQVLHTPGHTPGSICLLLVGYPLLFTGDTLFPGGIGKTTEPRLFAQALEAVETKLFTLPGETRIAPGHGDDTLIERERPHREEWRSRGW